ncbi:hypothetical protein FALBO_9614 [Fusarium albosuccineum]|uniref:Uncharacterized protein n=1 Tax=Fusarium albosuccineum TaxID=1237068 RepID=A0A8H4PBT9_9HYPO|nr:hypothetical protein FALBO_9614 [Fusarium albosuccineum]
MSTSSSPSPLCSLTDSSIITLPSRPSSRCFNRSTPSHYGHHTASRQPAQPASRISRHPYLDRGREHTGLARRTSTSATSTASIISNSLQSLVLVPRQLASSITATIRGRDKALRLIPTGSPEASQ